MDIYQWFRISSASSLFSHDLIYSVYGFIQCFFIALHNQIFYLFLFFFIYVAKIRLIFFHWHQAISILLFIFTATIYVLRVKAVAADFLVNNSSH